MVKNKIVKMTVKDLSSNLKLTVEGTKEEVIDVYSALLEFANKPKKSMRRK